MKTKTIKILSAALLASALLFAIAACNSGADKESNANDGSNGHAESFDVIDIGAGATVFLFEMTDGEGNVTSWNVHTDKTTVGEALVEVGLIEGTVSEFGMMVEYVNRIRADFMEDNAWWAFYIGGEMAMVGVDSTDIEEGVTYAFVYTPA